MRSFVACLVIVGSLTSSGFAADLTITLPGGVTMDFNYIPPGTFMMGSPEDERGRYDREDLHEVTLTQGYYIGVSEVTQAQWEALMGSNPAESCGDGGYGVGPNLPVFCVTWQDIYEENGYVDRLNSYLTSTSQPGAGSFGLPTEAQWERAARAGTDSRFSHGDVLECDDQCGSCAIHDQFMWWCGNDNGQVEPADSKNPNVYGLFDMHGNVSEWVLDRWTEHLGFDPAVDPSGPETGEERVNRGGNWFGPSKNCRSANRYGYHPAAIYYWMGFRLAKTQLAVVSPNGGEQWFLDQTYEISWTDEFQENARIELRRGPNLQSVIASSTPSDGSFPWHIPQGIPPASDYSIRVASVNDPALFDDSDNPFSVGNPRCYPELYAIPASIDHPSAVAIEDGLAVVTTAFGFYVLDITDPSSPTVLSQVQQPQFFGGKGMVLVEGIAYVGGPGGFSIVDLNDPTNPNVRSSYEMYYAPSKIRLDRQRGLAVLVSPGATQIEVVDIIDLDNPELVLRANTSAPQYQGAWDLALWGTLAFVADGASGVTVFDLSDLNNPPPIVNHIEFDGAVMAVEISGQFLAVSETSPAIHIVDLYPTTVVLGTLDLQPSEMPYQLSGWGSHVLAAGGSTSNLKVVDVVNPTLPNIAGLLPGPGFGRSVATDGPVALVANYDFGLSIADLSSCHLEAPLGGSWAARSRGVARRGFGLGFEPGKYVGVGYYSNMLSNDSEVWSAHWLNGTYGSVVHGPNGWVTVGHSGVAHSDDGWNWTAVNAGIPADMSGIASTPVGYLAVGGDTVARSTNGVDWISSNIGSSNLHSICYNNGTYLAVGFGQQIYSSVNGVTWVQRHSENSGWLFDVVCKGPQMVAVGEAGRIMTSNDSGETWNYVSNTNSAMYAVDYGAGVYVAVGRAGAIIQSEDGNTWIEVFSGTNQHLRDVLFDGTRFIVLADNGDILVSGPGPLPATVFEDDFETGGTSYWSETVQ
jgi:formylglycine-generating enzyme required for sulfatase activity